MVGQRQVAVLAVTLLALTGLSTLGAVIAPVWQPEPVGERYAYPRLPDAPADERGDAAELFEVRRDEVSIVVDGHALAGVVYAPVSGARHPAVVFVHGGGPGTRHTHAGQAERLAMAGIVTLTYDKRSAGYSLTSRDYSLLAGDALAAAAVLRARTDVDPELVGLLGTSEGGWVVPIAAARDARVAFAVLVAAPMTSPRRQVAWSLDSGLRRLGAPDGARAAVVTAFGAGGFDYVRHDPMPALRELTVPVLAIYGTDDRAVPALESARLLTGALDDAGHDRYTVRFFAGADHAIRVDGALAPGYLATVAGWVRGPPDSAAGERPRIAGAQPRQEYLSAEPATPAYGGAGGLLVALGLVLAGYLAAGLTRLVGRLRGRWPVAPSRPRLRRRLRLLLACGLASALGFTGFATVAIALGLGAADGAGARATITGGWLLLRVLAVLTAVLLVSTVAIAVSAYRDGWRPRGVERVRLFGVCGGTAVAVLLAAYWGMYAPTW